MYIVQWTVVEPETPGDVLFAGEGAELVDLKKLWYFTKIVRQFENRSSAHNNIPNFYFYN